MTETRVTCDRCRLPIEADRHMLKVESGSGRVHRAEADYCSTCFRLWLAWQEHGAEEACEDVKS